MTIVMPEWAVVFLLLLLGCWVASCLLNAWLTNEVREVCANRDFDQAAVLRILSVVKR